MLSYDQDRLLASSKRKEVESALRLDEPFRLDGLGLMLGVIRVEFADYKLTKASIFSLSWVSNPAFVPYADSKYVLCCRRIAGQWRRSSLSYWKLKAEGRISMVNSVSRNGRLKCGKECATDSSPPHVRRRRFLLNCNCAKVSVQLFFSLLTPNRKP